ncbi:hypothetical protein GE107_16910 [Cohnella sp. CFH 77786]|uniref:hypothetical protein n=1 Tax=Cohnella sp. CFH 77786 TaxID=2662265 RepID=UPI001C60AFB8|nr:hypothetical protein [Cohnella sp. CFH 77786]MBW5447737.1 hypothetical protein [Cohnella sp. CFH 77786]
MYGKRRMRRRLKRRQKVLVTVRVDKIQTRIWHPLLKKLKIIVIVNNQFTNAANATQLASGAGRSSAAGNNAAIASSNTEQQQGVGAGGTATNSGMEGTQSEPHRRHLKDPGICKHRRLCKICKHRKCCKHRKFCKLSRRKKNEIVIVLNNQVHRSGNESQSAATQVASGGESFSASGTNAAIESSNTKQQQAVGGGPGAQASNLGMSNDQIET